MDDSQDSDLKSIADKQVNKCRYCNSGDIERIPRAKLVKAFLFWMPLGNYICYSCKRKQHKKLRKSVTYA